MFVREPETVCDRSRSIQGVPAYQRLQAKSCTIALAVLSIYAVDFAINAGWYSARVGQTDRIADAKPSPIIMPKSDRRHSANCKAAAWFCLGYALPP